MDMTGLGHGDAGHSFLSIPPFPKRRSDNFMPSSTTATLSDGELDELGGLIREARVGGTYWGVQPDLGAPPYVLDTAEIAARRYEVDPWHLLAGAREVICEAGDPLQLIAGLLGVPTRLPNDAAPARLPATGELRELLRAALGPTLPCNPFTGEPLSWPEAIGLCRQWRELIDANRAIAAAYGFANWKRATTEALLWNGSPDRRFDRRPAELRVGQKAAVWRSRTSPARLAELEQAGVVLVEVEDGFIRSAGLGANCVPPQSIVVDSEGIHFDGRSPSALERILQEGRFTPDLLERAETLRRRITERGLSKYDVGQQKLARRSPQRHILVPAQVENDRAVLSSIGPPLTNFELLKRVRAARPDAYVIFKPHPDVEAGHRKGAVPDPVALQLADEIAREGSIASWIELVDEVHVNSSLAGFEALLRGKAVSTHGVPFYAGWGLTTDVGSVPERRTTRRSLDELVAAALILYPRYVDPITNLPCSPEVVIDRMASGAGKEGGSRGALVLARRIQGWLKQRLSRNAPQ
jgi:capsular polysaccharide export protein